MNSALFPVKSYAVFSPFGKEVRFDVASQIARAVPWTGRQVPVEWLFAERRQTLDSMGPVFNWEAFIVCHFHKSLEGRLPGRLDVPQNTPVSKVWDCQSIQKKCSELGLGLHDCVRQARAGVFPHVVDRAITDIAGQQLSGLPTPFLGVLAQLIDSITRFHTVSCGEQHRFECSEILRHRSPLVGLFGRNQKHGSQ
ncbi:MAG: hypothetical protein HY290_14755 [Planctomycetia bacterium]|nr:hypothetical protein [Planctomycetia bacterium]